MEIFFLNQKSNYSINVQIINTLNCKIINYASGFWDSQYNTHCFVFTKLRNNSSQYLQKDERCWEDAAYFLQKWLMISYKSPAISLKLNQIFNFYFFRICFWSEHIIGFLKSRF